jgi:nitrous oxidase accessory protein NosD
VALDWSYSRNVTANNILVYDVDYGIKIDADEASPPNPSRDCSFNNMIMHGRDGNGIGLQQKANHIQFSNIELYGFNKGIDVDSDCDYIYFSNVYINGGDGECDFDADHISIDNLIIEGCSANGIHLGGSYISMANCQLIDNAGSYGNKITGTNILISNCQVVSDNGYYAGFVIEGGSDITIDNCVVTGSRRGAYILDGSQHWKITDCSFTGNTQDGIYIASGGSTDWYIISNCDLTGNGGTSLNDKANGANSLISNNLI